MILLKDNEMFLLCEIVKKNFSSKYKDSVLGILWTVLNPLFMLIIFTIIFSTIFKNNIENYPLYFLSGWCIIYFFNGVIGASMGSIKNNKNILQRTPAPKHIFVLGTVLSEVLNFIILLILLGVVMIVTQSPFYWLTLPFSIIPIMCLFIIVTGLSLIISIFSVYYSDIQHLWGIVAMLLIYASAIFYPMEIVPEPYRQILMSNPIFWVIDQFRCCIYLGTFPNIIFTLNLILMSLIILIFGIIIFKKYEDKVVMKF